MRKLTFFKMKDFLNSYFSDLTDLQAEKLKGDGGHRSYTRLKKGPQTFILMSCGEEDPSLKLFIEVQNRLKNFVHVPKIFYYDLKKGQLLLEDLGDQSLERIFLNKEKACWLSLYQKALRQLIDLQSQVQALEQDPVFDSQFFLNEIDSALFDTEKYFCVVLSQQSFDKGLLKSFKEEIELVLSHFKEEDLVYCHRDFHSRNLMIKNNKVQLIDFQDAGKGPWCYDLASLLYDSYVALPNREELARFYFENLNPVLKEKVKNLKRVDKMLKLQFLQRGFKACGRFCAFKVEDNKDSHLKYLGPSFKLLEQTARGLNYPGISKYAHSLAQRLKKMDSF